MDIIGSAPQTFIFARIISSWRTLFALGGCACMSFLCQGLRTHRVCERCSLIFLFFFCSSSCRRNVINCDAQLTFYKTLRATSACIEMEFCSQALPRLSMTGQNAFSELAALRATSIFIMLSGSGLVSFSPSSQSKHNYIQCLRRQFNMH